MILRPRNYGFFIWIDLRFALPPEGQGMSGLSQERALTKQMFAGGVYMAIGENFCGEYYGWYRLTFTTALLEQSLARLERVLYGPPSHPQTKSQCPTLTEAVEEAAAKLRKKLDHPQRPDEQNIIRLMVGVGNTM